MATPGKSRQSGIPGPGRTSSIPTPGRPRSSSSLYQGVPAPSPIDANNEMSRAFADAIRANDPAQHRLNTAMSTSSISSLSPKSASVAAPSGRRSVAGRPSSVASSSSVLSHTTRGPVKTPITSTRPSSRAASRQSDVYSAASAKSRAFEVGDNVRIESLGFEGVLRYLGEIDGKPGQWAGVQLGGGFAGKGKNNGSVGGVQYFQCPEKCGVFVAVSKLSAPTVGNGARPPSVASTRNGRATPATMSGRVTPSYSTYSTSYSMSRTPSASLSNGRITPAAGRATPSASMSRLSSAHTPSARPKPVPTVKTPGLSNKITEGSRASKYVNVTAKELSSRKGQNPRVPPSPRGVTSPSSRATGSPTRGPGSPFATPKPLTTSKLTGSFGKGRPSGTPRARLPSNVSMPPPASPFSKGSQSLQDEELPDDLDSSDGPIFTGKLSYSRPGSSASHRSEDGGLVARLQSRLDALEYENERLRLSAATMALQPSAVIEPEAPAPPPAPAPAPVEPVAPEENEEFEKLKGVHQATLAQIARLQEELADSKTRYAKQEDQIDTLKTDLERVGKEKDDLRVKGEEELTGVRGELETVAKEVEGLKKVCEDKEAVAKEVDETLKRKEGEIKELKADLDSATFTFTEERKELGLQIDELRIAGQETIALYEERLSDIEAQRYDLQSRLDSLLQSASAHATSPIPKTNGAPQSAAEIDNETLREQVQHLQKNIAMLEEIIEDARANEEKAKANALEQIKRSQEKVESMRKELSEGRKEVDRISRAEAGARGKIEEVEEALRESTMALESARAETETLRSELADLDNLVEGNGDSDISTRVVEYTRRIASEREKNEKEIANLKRQLEEKDNSSQGKEIASLQAEIAKLKTVTEDLEEALKSTRTDLEDKDRDLRDLKKRIRDVPVVNGSLDTSKGLSPSSSKNELAGMKHIVVELQKENSSAQHRIKVLESENELLKSEAEQLRQEVAILEENLDKNISQEENFGASDMSDDVVSLQRKLRDQGAELEQLRKKLSEMDIKHARTIHDLNKEISELEALVESKIYREDELEQEIERLKEKTARYKKASKTPTDTEKLRSSTTSTASLSSVSSSEIPRDGRCEICEQPGHDLFNCDLLKDETPAGGQRAQPASLSRQSSVSSVSSTSSSEPYCEDSPSFRNTMSYASVAARNAPSPDHQPRPDPSLLTTDSDVGEGSSIIDSSSKLNVVNSDFKAHPHTDVEGIPPDSGSEVPPAGRGFARVGGNSGIPNQPRRRHPHREDAFTIWQQVLDYVVRPQVASGLLGVVNIGIIAGVGYTFYSKPHLRASTKAITSTIAATLALVTGEGVAVEQYLTRTPEGQSALQHARERRHWLAQYLHNFFVRVNPYKGAIGIANMAIVGSLGYVGYVNRNQPWDRRTVSAISAGLLALVGAEGYLLEHSS